MASFKFHDVTFTVRSMTRTAALECTKEFEIITPLYAEATDDLLREADWLAVKHAVTVIRIGEDVFTDGVRLIKGDDDEPLTLVLPITREPFFALPMNLTEAWITAAHMANSWYIEIAKKAFGLTAETNNAPKSGNASSNASTPLSLATKTTGATSTLLS